MTLKKQDKVFQDLHRLLESQNFKSKGELEKFMDGLMGKPVPSFPKESLTIKEQAQDLIFEAVDLPEDKGYELALKALQMDPDCIEAYEYLGALETITETAILYYKNGIEIGKRIFSKTYFKDSIGQFWMVHETRAFMRCMQAYADLVPSRQLHRDQQVLVHLPGLARPNDRNEFISRTFHSFGRAGKKCGTSTRTPTQLNRRAVSFQAMVRLSRLLRN